MNDPTPRAAFRRTAEDGDNIAAIQDALRSPGTPIATVSSCIRAALRASAYLARRGDLRPTLADYRADLAGDAPPVADRAGRRFPI